jgi:hypothetical protein
MLQTLLTGQLKEKPTYRVWCLYSLFVHGGKAPTQYSPIILPATAEAVFKEKTMGYGTLC